MKTARPQLLTTAQAAELLGISAARVRQLAAADQLPGQKVGAAWLFKRSVVERFAKLERPAGVAIGQR